MNAYEGVLILKVTVQSLNAKNADRKMGEALQRFKMMNPGISLSVELKPEWHEVSEVVG